MKSVVLGLAFCTEIRYTIYTITGKENLPVNKTVKKVILTVFAMAVIMLCFAVTSFAADADITATVGYQANAEDANTVIHTQNGRDGSTYLFLPSSADLANLVLTFDGTEATLTGANGSIAVTSGSAFDLTALFDAGTEEYAVKLTSSAGQAAFTVMKSANVRSMYLVSDDPVNQGRPWVDTVKTNKASGKMSFIGVDGEVDFSLKMTEIKGRGNSTFKDYVKKPYQIKLEKKVDLIGNQSSEKCKKWVLLTNAPDNTLIHNSVTFALAQALGMAYTTNYEPIDLYYDGEYRGSYLLTEKVEIDSSRIDIENLDDAIEEANEGNAAFENPVVVTRTTASKGEKSAAADSKGSYKFVTGLVEPALPEGATHHAYLLEVDYISRYREEQSGFVTTRGQSIVTKNPEYLTKETGAYISAFWQEFEDAVYSEDGYNKKTGKYYYDYCDLDSLVKLYLINELGKNFDSFGSSCFFYLPEDSDIMYAGPVWDYDICYGNGHHNRAIASNPENLYAATKYLANGLIKIESFRDAVKATLNKEDGEFYTAVMALLGEDGTIEKQAATIDASQKMNFKIWDITSDYSIVVKDGAEKTYENAVDFFQYYVETRVNWLSDETSSWNGDNFTITTDNGTKRYNSLTLLFEKFVNFFKTIAAWFNSLFA